MRIRSSAICLSLSRLLRGGFPRLRIARKPLYPTNSHTFGIKLSQLGGLAVLTLVLAECALERVPRELWSHPAVVKHAERRGKMPGQILLDRSYHHAAMVVLKDAVKRGRPDILHLSLLEAFGTPLNWEGRLRVYAHTLDDFVLSFNREVRLPRNYDRFKGLIEQLYEVGRVPLGGQPLINVEKKSLRALVEEAGPGYVVALTRVGRPALLEEVARKLFNHGEGMVLIGGFPSGHFRAETLVLAHDVMSIDPEGLDAWIVVSRVIYDYERAAGLPERRLEGYGET